MLPPYQGSPTHPHTLMSLTAPCTLLPQPSLQPYPCWPCSTYLSADLCLTPVSHPSPTAVPAAPPPLSCPVLSLLRTAGLCLHSLPAVNWTQQQHTRGEGRELGRLPWVTKPKERSWQNMELYYCSHTRWHCSLY